MSSGRTAEVGAESRREFLRPQLIRLRQQTVDHPTATGGETVACGQHALRLGGVEWAAVIQAFKDVGSGRNLCHLVAESVALEMRVGERGGESEDVAVASAMQRDLAVARRALLQARNIDRADLAAQTIQRVERLALVLRAKLSPADLELGQRRAEYYPQEAGNLLGQRATGAWREFAIQPPSLGVGALSTKAWFKPAAIGAALVVVLLVWFCSSGDELRPLSRRDFQSEPAVRGIKSDPPALLVTLDAAQWKKLGADGQDQLLQQVAERAETAGYERAEFATDAGAEVGRWSSGSSPELY